MRSSQKFLFFLGLSLIVLALSGCGMLNDYVSNAVETASEIDIQTSDQYKQYERYQAEGVLDENGVFPLPEPNDISESTIDEKAIRVTLATNSFLNCVYYSDEEAKTPILSNELYLDPGECLFVANVSVSNDISNLYDFSCFRIWSYDLEGNRSKTPYKEISSRSGLLLKIPEDINCAGFSVEPIGYYTNRHITAKAYFLSNGQETMLPNGQWTVNKTAFKDSTDISAVTPYSIEYDYSAYKDDYYFVKSKPLCWHSKESNHTVIFKEVSPIENESSFVIEMHPYITMTVNNSCISWAAGLPILGNNGDGIIQSISRDSKQIEQEYSGKSSFDIKKLKVGEAISIHVGKEYKITGTGVNIGSAIPLGSEAENGYEYSFIIPETSKNIRIDITERNSNAEGKFEGYNMANADVSIILENGAPLKIGQELPGDDEKVSLIITPHEGFYIEGFTEKNDYSFISKNVKFSRLEKDLPTLLDAHPAIHFISFNLVFSDDAGTYTYKLDGKDVTNTSVHDARLGQTLKVEYMVNDGYSIIYNWFGANAFSEVWNWAGRNDSISDKIKITADMDGTTIDRETFGITVEKAR